MQRHTYTWNILIYVLTTTKERGVCSGVIYSKTVVFSQNYVQCSRIRLNGGVSFITYRVHVYKIL